MPPVAYLVTIWQATATVEDSKVVTGESDHSEYDEIITTKDTETIDALFEELDMSGLESWPPKLAASAQSLLAEYHNVFSLEPSKIGCTHSSKCD